MTEQSTPWGGISTGDCGPYTSTRWSDIWATLFTSDQTKQGIIPWYGGKLLLSSSTNNYVVVASGAAVVHGTFYKSDASVTVYFPPAVSTTRTDYIVLRKSFTGTNAQTVRIFRLSTELDGQLPTLTQNTTTYWDIIIGIVTVTAAGAINITLRTNDMYLHLGVPVSGVIHSISTQIPAGFAELESARGRFIVGLVSGGEISGTLGTALTDLGSMSHIHAYTGVVAHTHDAYGAVPDVSGESPQVWYSAARSLNYGFTWRSGLISSTGSTSCNTAASTSTPPYLQLMTLVKS